MIVCWLLLSEGAMWSLTVRVGLRVTQTFTQQLLYRFVLRNAQQTPISTGTLLLNYACGTYQEHMLNSSK